MNNVDITIMLKAYMYTKKIRLCNWTELSLFHLGELYKDGGNKRFRHNGRESFSNNTGSHCTGNDSSVATLFFKALI